MKIWKYEYENIKIWKYDNMKLRICENVEIWKMRIWICEMFKICFNNFKKLSFDIYKYFIHTYIHILDIVL